MNIWKFAIPLGLIATGFVILGDQLTFLPAPVRNASLQSRQYVTGLWPNWLQPTDRDARREQQVDTTEKNLKVK
jgi:hypothetical protein